MEKNKGGRPKGSKDSFPRTVTKKSKRNEQAKKEIDAIQSTELSKLKSNKYLGKEGRKRFEEYCKLLTPLESLKKIEIDMRLRAGIARDTEIDEWEYGIARAKEELKEILETGLVRGRKVSEPVKETRIRELRKKSHTKMKLSSALTTLQGEITKVVAEREKIESGRPETNITLYNVMSGKGDQEKNEQVEVNIFKPSKDLKERKEKYDTCEDAEFKEDKK